jgi:multiple sugar transport system substrate-binding protein
MRIYRDTIKSFFITLAVIALLGLVGYLIGSYLLSPKQAQSGKPQYKARVEYPNGPIKLTYWRTVDGKEVFEPILRKWQEYHPNVSIEIINIPYAEYDRRLSEAAAKGTLPDMFMLKSDWVPRYKNSLATAPAEVFNRQDYEKTFAPAVSTDLIISNEIKAVSYGVPTLGLYYNASMLAQAGLTTPPQNWQELVDANSKIVKKSGNGLIQSGVALGTAGVANAASIMPLLMMQNGAIMTNTPPTEATFQKPTADNYPSSARAVDFYTSFAKPGKSTYSWSDGFGDSTQAFISGKTAMIIDYPYKYLTIKAQAPGLNFKMAKVPQLNPNSPVNYTEFWAEGVSKKSQYIDIAWDFYNFMTTYDIMNLYSVPTMKPASRLDLAKDQSQDSLIGPFAAQVASARDYYKGNNTTTDVAILEMINSALTGFDPAISVRAASDKVTSSIRQFPY